VGNKLMANKKAQTKKVRPSDTVAATKAPIPAVKDSKCPDSDFDWATALGGKS
jgi:hypothetical protein